MSSDFASSPQLEFEGDIKDINAWNAREVILTYLECKQKNPNPTCSSSVVSLKFSLLYIHINGFLVIDNLTVKM